ncbi:MAG TPA: C45 family peptidase [Bacteroidales bacterium]|nr:C45 family peptidase [Bacteroidales bacterium]
MKVRLFFVITLCVTFNFELFAQPYNYIENQDGKRIFRNGELIVKEGVPFLTVKGDPYESGLQYGVLLNDYLLKMNHTVDSLIENYIGGFFLKKWFANAALSFKIRKLDKIMPHDFIREFEGIADGSDLSLKEVKTLAYFPQLFFKISCSAFILRNEKHMVHGRNLDWPGIEVLTHFPLIVNYHIKGKHPVTNLTFIGYPGVYTGMNHSGLSMSINMNSAPAENGKDKNDYNIDMPMAFKVRDILGNAENINEVDEQFKGYSSHAWFITVGSKSDFSGAIFELTRGRVIKNEMQNDYLAIANLSLSDVGRYQYSPISMFNQSNISREKKLKELNEKIYQPDLVEKSYQILSCTENHDMVHNPFFTNSINNYNTIKSCIMDNMNGTIYFAYDENLAAFNKYLKYDINSGTVAFFKEKKDFQGKEYFSERLKYQNWYIHEVSEKKKKSEQDYKKIISKIKSLKLEPSYNALLLSYYYSKLKNDTLAFENAEKYIALQPDYYHSYYNKFRIMRDKGDYMAAIVALEEMMQTSTTTPSDTYRAYIHMIKMYDKLLETDRDPMYIQKINTLVNKINYKLNQYFKDDKTLEDIEFIEQLESKYDE